MYCPKCGSETFTECSVKSYRCASCSFHIFLNVGAAVSGIITNRKREILFTVRKFDPCAGMLDLPGGFVDYEENAEEALKREISEELGVEVIKSTYYRSLPNLYDYEGIRYHTLDFFYFCEVDKIEDITVGDDVSGYVFEPLEALDLDRIGLRSPRQAISELRKYLL